jgi:hypothetical protein
MALIQGIHLLAHGDKVEARRIAEDIQRYQRLLVGTNTVYGAGVYAWYANRLSETLQDWPAVLFEIEETEVVPVVTRAGVPRGFFRIPGRIGDYVRIQVLTFTNLT